MRISFNGHFSRCGIEGSCYNLEPCNTAKSKGIHGAQTPILSVSPSRINIIIINYKMFALPHLSTFLINAHMKLKHCKTIGPWSSEGINW